MKIAGTQVDVATRTFEIYVSGCTRGCEGCHNPNLHDFTFGISYMDYLPRLEYQLSRPFISNVAIMGGEPLEQGRINLEALIDNIRLYDKYLNRKIWLYTGFDLKDVPLWVKHKVDFIKCGSYNSSMTSDNYICKGIQLASTNQIIYERGIDY